MSSKPSQPWIGAMLLMLAGLPCAVTRGQANAALQNPGFEAWSDDGSLQGWHFVSLSGATIQLESDACFSGAAAAKIDATAAGDEQARLFSNVMQSLDATNWRGKRLRFRAAVRTSDLIDSARAQLWFRVDRASDGGPPEVIAFDNMAARPIRNIEWQHYEIVLDVSDDATDLSVGMFIEGRGNAWIDDATLEAVGADVPVTEMQLDNETPSQRSVLPPLVQKAIQESEQAPRQPFFSPWLVLAAAVITLLSVGGLPPRTAAGAVAAQSVGKRWIEGSWAFAFRFSFLYWILYGLPLPFRALIPIWGPQLGVAYEAGSKQVIEWGARNVFGIQHELVPPNGSGDTTYAYIAVALTCGIAFVGAATWTLVDRRRSNYAVTRDLLSSFLRYVLALTMLGYGLAKVAWDFNQFPSISDYQLQKTWGDSSPMNVVWSFMGASRPYTVFAGLGEILGAALLLFRRTTLAGALVVFGVMTNVMMLNFCYDIPVKLYSAHLVMMAVYLSLADADRLSDFFFRNRAVKFAELRPLYAPGRWIWMQRSIKLAILIIGFAMPIYLHVGRQVRHFRELDAAALRASEEAADKYLLTRRGFRWISEVPFNR